jgi:anaerobic magnesium-protoporphyrin IX monomethyl ester cyclase
MRVVLINPPRVNGIPVVREDRCEITDRSSVIPPCSLLEIAGILRGNGHDVRLIDANAENLDYNEVRKTITPDTDVIVFRFTPTTFNQDIQTSSIAKQTSTNIITIGLCWTLRSYANDVMDKAPDLDIYVLSDDFCIIGAIINAIGNGALKDVAGIAYRDDGDIVVAPPISNRIDFDLLPMPAYDLVNPKNYYNNTPRKIRFMAMYTSKGCPNGCVYCTVRRTGWWAKSSQRVVEEMRYLATEQNVQEIAFFDEVFSYDRKRAEEICRQLIEQRISIRWYCNITANTVDKALLELMKKAGCSGLSIGVESGSSDILVACSKANTVEQAYNAIQWAKQCGLKVFASFIVGLPGETWSTVMDTTTFLKKALPHGAQVNIAVPYPGTKLYTIASEKGWVDSNYSWENLFQHDSAMNMPSISQAELYKARQLLYRSLYFNPAWVWQNVKYVLKNPSDFSFGVRYYLKSMSNLVVHKMIHAH